MHITKIALTRKTLMRVFPFLAVISSGCANLSPMTISLTDLGTASRSEHSMAGLKVMRTVNITGLGPNEVVGSISLDPDPNLFDPLWFLDLPTVMGEKDYPDSLSLRLSPGCSSVRETKFDGTVSAEDVATVRDGLQELTKIVSDKIGLEIKQLILSNSAETLADNTKDNKGLLQVLQSQYPTDNLSEVSKVTDTLGIVNAQLGAVQQKINEKRKELDAALKKPGIIVTRWAQERKKSSMLDAFKTAATFQSSSQSQQEGFLVLGSPRVTSLVMGDDFLKAIKDGMGKCCTMKTLFESQRTYLTYYQLSAKHIAWGETRSGANSKSIQADISKIAGMVQPYLKGTNLVTALKDLEVKARLDISGAYDYGNNGLLSGGKTESYPIQYGNAATLNEEQDRSNEYLTIYNARGTMEHIIARTLKPLKHKNITLDNCDKKM